MRRIIVVALVVVSVLAGSVLFYFAMLNRKFSEKLSAATAAMEISDYDRARKLLAQLAASDPLNEKVNGLLAELFLREKEYEQAAVYFSKAARLNPLDAENVRKMFRCAAIAHSDAVLIPEYMQYGSTREIYPETEFACALAFYRQGLTSVSDKILARLRAQKSPYADLAEANMLLARANIETAKNLFRAVLNSRPADSSCAAYALLGLARCEFAEGALDAAEKTAESVALKDDGIRSETEILRGKISLARGNPKSALELFKRAQKIQRSNMSLVIDISELAMAVSDGKTIDDFRRTINTADKRALMLGYYLDALSFAMSKSDSKARDALQLSGDFQERPVARILAFKFACELDKPDEAVSVFKYVVENGVPERLKKALAADIETLFKKNSADSAAAEKIARMMLELYPDNPSALRVLAVRGMNRRDYVYVLDLAQRLLKQDASDRFALETAVAALLSLDRPEEGLRVLGPYLEKPDSFIINAAARFAAAANRRSEAVSYMELAAKDGFLSPSSITDFAAYIDARVPSEFEKFLSLAEKSGGAQNLAAAQVARARKLIIIGDFQGAEAAAKKAAEIYPKGDLAYSVRALAFYLSGDKAAALKAVEEGLKEIPDSAFLNLRKASLLIEAGGAQNFAAAKVAAESAAASGETEALRYCILSQAYAGLGEPQKALDAAREAERIAPRNPEVILQKGLSLLDNGNYEDALKVLLSVQKTSSDARIISSVEKALKLACDRALSFQAKKNIADSVLECLPENALAKKISDDAKAQFEKK